MSHSAPRILIQDHTHNPPLTTHYHTSTYTIDLALAYRSIKNLRLHPGRGHIVLNPNNNSTTVTPCTTPFLDAFWASIATLLDYFADFAPHDTIAMQTIWFHLLDSIQTVAASLPHKFWTEERSGVKMQCCTHAATFGGYYEQAVKLLLCAIHPMARKTLGAIVKVKNGGILGASLCLTGGGWRAGLKEWQQFLLRDSPGFADRTSGLLMFYRRGGGGSEGDEVVVPKMDIEGREVAVRDGEDGKTEEDDRAVVERYLPTGALAIMQRWTDRLRQIATEEAAARDEVNGGGAKLMMEFEAKTVNNFEAAHHYTSPLTHSTILTQPCRTSQYSVSAPRRHNGRSDADETIHRPNWMLLDEMIGSFRAVGRFVHPMGEGEEFRMLRVLEKREREGRKVEGVFGEMFDEWSY